MNIKLIVAVSLALLFLIPISPSLASDSSGANIPPMHAITAAIKRVAFSPSSSTPARQDLKDHIAEQQNVIVFTAPPRETLEEATEIYKPVADFLSKTLGKRVEYTYPGTWGVYRTEMLKGGYDIVFDGPHFNSYRMEKLSHNILVKIPERHEFTVIVKKDQAEFRNLKQMAGRTFCTHAPPNLGTLVLLSQFDNPSRQPMIINTKGWDKIYAGVISGKCVAGVLPALNLKKYDQAGLTRIIYKGQAMPNQAFSAGPRVTPEDQEKIAHALVSPEAGQATAKLRTAYKVGDSFALANNQEYRGLAEYLRNEWGYY